MGPDKKTNNSLPVRLTLSLILIVLISTTIEFNNLADLLLSMDVSFFVLALFLAGLEKALLAYKWNVLLAAKKISLPFLKILKTCYLSSFIGTFLPSSLGVDLVRIYSLYRHNSKVGESISSVFVDRIIALFALFTVVLTSALLFPRVISNSSILSSTVIMLICLTLFVVILLNRSLIRMAGVTLNIITPERSRTNLRETYNAFSEYTKSKVALFYVLMLSFVFQITRILIVYFVYRSIGEATHIIYFFIFVPVVTVLTMLPISVSGIGIREGAFVYLFSQVGMPVPQAFAVSILVYALTLIATIPGGIIYLLEGFPRRQSVATFDPF
jgi:glycosyltransferase 2 family protein